jgi:hypothetical protein
VRGQNEPGSPRLKEWTENQEELQSQLSVPFGGSCVHRYYRALLQRANAWIESGSQVASAPADLPADVVIE